MKEEKKVPTKIVKGGFRSTLALILSIIALTFSVITYNQSAMQTQYQVEIAELKAKLEKMKQETAERVSKIRQETARAIKNLGIEIEKRDEKSGSSENE